MNKETGPSKQAIEPHLQVGVVQIPVSGLKPEIIGRDGTVLRETNLHDEEIQQKIESAFVNGASGTQGKQGKSDFTELVKRIRSERSKAIAVAGVGALTIFVAGAGFEFGVRHGKDAKEVINFFKHRG